MSSGAPRQNSGRKSWRLRTRLAAGLAVLFVALLGLVAYSHFQYLNDRRDARLEDMQRVSQTLAASFDGLIYDLESLALSTSITLGDANLTVNDSASVEVRETVNAYLDHLLEGHGLIRALFVTDTRGIVIFDNDNSNFLFDLSDRNYIKALQNGEPVYWSNGFKGVQTGNIVVTHSRAIVNRAGETTGYFIVAVDAAAMAQRLPVGVVDEGHFSIVDNNGLLILRLPQDPNIPLGTDVASWTALEAARAEGSAVIRDRPLPVAPEDSYGALTPMASRGWVVGYSLPEGAVEGGTTGLFLRDMAILGAIVLAAFVIAWAFASRMVQPLTRLTQIAGAISRGEATEDPAGISSGNAEVLLLADTMSQMRNSIQEREEQLRAQNHALEALERFGESLAAELDLERSIQAVMDAGVVLVEAEAVHLLYREQGGRQRIAITGPRPALVLPEDHEAVREVLGGKVVHVDDLPHEPAVVARYAPGETPPRSVLGIPITSRTGEVEGTTLFLHSGPAAFTAQHERLANGLARWASIVLENAKLYAQSQEVVAELARSNAAKDDFLGIVSHELRTPITTIYGGTLLLRLRRESLPEQAFNDMIVSISEEAERLHHLVEDLLAIARTELVNERRPVEVPDVLHTAITDFSTTHRRRVNVEIEDEIPPAMGDSTYFRQVVTNLISNADKYTPADLPLLITAAKVDDEVVIKVKDDGPGIPEDELPHVFESFYRARGASEKASGSGLGLTVCKRLIEALGGRIWAQNRPEGGLEVGFTLKAAVTAQPATVRNAPGDGVDGTTQVADGTPPRNGHAP